jgi:hypothetical protein
MIVDSYDTALIFKLVAALQAALVYVLWQDSSAPLMSRSAR